MNVTWMLLEVTTVLILALAGTRLARKSRAAVRHVIIATAFAVLMILPLASAIAPAVRIEVPATVQAAIAPFNVEPVLDVVEPIVPARGETSAPGPATTGSMWSWPSLSSLVLGGWIAGIVVFLMPVVVGLWQVRSLRRSGVPWREGVATTKTLAAEVGVRRHIDVLRHESVPGPMTCGIAHPAIVLPMDAGAWAPEDLRRAIVHELEHIRRADWVTHCLARVIAACYWFHPVVWVAWRQLVVEAERACDDAVLRDSEATAYADQLVGLAARLSAASNQPQLAMANRRDLTTRVMAVLDGAQRRGRAGVAWVGMACVACALLVTTISPLRIVAATAVGPAPAHTTGAVIVQAAGQGVSSPSPKFDLVSIKPCAGLAPPGVGRGTPPSAAQSSPGYVHWDCVSLAELIDQAYVTPDTPLLNVLNRPPLSGFDLELPGAPRRIRGGPDWVESDRFVIEAKASGEAGVPSPFRVSRFLPDAMNQALKAMLADRFQLKLSRATEQRPMYALTVAKGGLKIPQTAPGKCWQRPLGLARGETATPPPGFEGTPACGLNSIRKMDRGIPQIEITHGSLKDFAIFLAGMMDRYVLDQTKVDGRFSFKFEYLPDEHTPSNPGRGEYHTQLVANLAAQGIVSTPSGPRPEPRTDGPTIFKAIEGLGLHLEPTKGPAEYLQIASVQRPRPDLPAELFEPPARAQGARR